MKKIVLLISLTVLFNFLFGQKMVTCKKGNIKQNDVVIANYDGVGSIFKWVKLGVFAPDGKDTIIRISEEDFDPKDPLFPGLTVAYKLEFLNTSIPYFYVSNTKRAGTRFLERDAMEMIFNDSVPVLIKDGKLDMAAADQFRARYSYDLDKQKAFIAKVEDSVTILNAQLVERDLSKPVSFKMVNDKSTQFDIDQTFEIYQDGKLLGRVLKKVTGGNFPEAKYTFWKSITPVVIEQIDLKYSPVASCTTGPTPFPISIFTVAGKKELKLKGTYTQLELPIVNMLIAGKFL